MKQNDIYGILEKDGTVKRVPLEEYLKECITREQIENKRVARDMVGKILVSTVFLGVDHRWDDNGRPEWFETMVFDAPDEDDRMRRYETIEEARAGHEQVLKEVRGKYEA